MKCPMFETGKLKHGSVQGPDGRECLREERAWWNKSQGWCNINALTMELVNIFVTLKEIKEMMPNIEQFRR